MIAKAHWTDFLEQFVDEIYENYDLPGVSIGISIGDDFKHCMARGYRDFTMQECGDRYRLQPDDLFHCASVTKLFTSSAILKLLFSDAKAQLPNGKPLELNSKLCDILPDLPFQDSRYASIRLWNLLTHTSGMGDCADYRWYAPEIDDQALSRYVYSKEVCDQPMLWSAMRHPFADSSSESHSDSNRFRYSNVAYEILGHIISRYSSSLYGETLSYEEFVSRALLQPCGMHSSSLLTFQRKEWGTDLMAKPHELNPLNRIQIVSDYPYHRAHSPSSTLTSNTKDLLQWGRCHMNGSVFAPDLYQEIWKPYAIVPNNGESMCLGWFCRKHEVSDHTYTLFGHEGTDDGFRASFWLCPELDLVSVVLCNLSGAPVKKINKRLFSAIVSQINSI